MAAEQDPRGTMLLLEEYFDREDARFVETLRKAYHAPFLAGFIDRWKKDPRPWARQQVLIYLAQPLNTPGHHVVVKRLFKQAEANADHELLAAFLVAFDRLVRRVRKTRRNYEWIRETRQYLVHETEYLGATPNSIPVQLPRKFTNPVTGKETIYPAPRPYFIERWRLFSPRTRRYLRRRAWRYFRRLGHQRPADYLPSITRALLSYTDADVRQPENLLDNWGLMQACFGRHPALEFSPSGVKLAAGHTLAELSAAPKHEALWQSPDARPQLLELLLQAKCRPVRLWARQMLERHHADLLATLPIETIRKLLDSDDAELQQFAAGMLGTVPGIGDWPFAAWQELLQVRDPTAVALVCEQMQKHLKSDRLTADQCLDLATAAAIPVARLGLAFLQARKWDSADDRRLLAAIGAARAAAVGGELAKWALRIVGSPAVYDRDVVVALFDSLLEPVRLAAFAWLEGSPAGQDDPLLWSRLLETPFAELRLKIVDLLAQRSVRPPLGPQDLSPLWTSVLLGVERGGRQKVKAVHQLADAIVRRPETACDLLCVLAVALRSIRRPEQRGALAAIALVLERLPELAAQIQHALPELSLTAPAPR